MRKLLVIIAGLASALFVVGLAAAAVIQAKSGDQSTVPGASSELLAAAGVRLEGATEDEAYTIPVSRDEAVAAALKQWPENEFLGAELVHWRNVGQSGGAFEDDALVWVVSSKPPVLRASSDREITESLHLDAIDPFSGEWLGGVELAR
jgi:hypothetical protein